MTDHIIHTGKGKTIIVPDDAPQSKSKEKLARIGVMYRRRQREMKPIEPIELEEHRPPLYISRGFMYLRRDQCKWPMDDYNCCGDKCLSPWSSYCQLHDDMAHNRKPLKA